MSETCDRLDDSTLLARFEAMQVAPADFGHREHIRLAFAMLQGAELDDSAARFRRALRAFASAAGAAGKYHETLTWAYLALVQRRMYESPCATSFELVERHPDLLEHPDGAIARHYDVAAITASPLARAVFVLPERS